MTAPARETPPDQAQLRQPHPVTPTLTNPWADRPARATVVGAYPGAEFFLLWGTEDGGTSIGPGSAVPTLLPFFAGPGGTRLLLARYAPESSVPEPTGNPEALAREVRERLPGLAEVFDDPDSGMHATDTIDYGICLAGEICLELDSGQEILLTPGTCVVQLGSRHAWHNRGSEPAVMCFVGIGARRQQPGKERDRVRGR